MQPTNRCGCHNLGLGRQQGELIGWVSLGGDCRKLEGIKVVVPSGQPPECKPSTKEGSFVLFDDVSSAPRTRWKHFVVHRKRSINI